MRVVLAGLAVLALAGCGSSGTISSHGQQIQTACVPAGNAINRISTLLDGVKAGTVIDADAESELKKAGGDLATAVEIGKGKLQVDATDAQNAAGRLRVALVTSDQPGVQAQTLAMVTALSTLNADCP